MKPIKILIVLLTLMTGTVCFADTVNLKSGDVMNCDFLTEYIGLQADYQNLFFKKDFVKSMISHPDLTDQYVIKTINNDQYSGRLINDKIEIAWGTEKKVLISHDKIKELFLDSAGETYELDTTIFVMQNGDRFSGRMLTEQLTLSAGQLTLPLKQADMERIEFREPGSKQADVYLTDGSLVSGELSEDVLGIAPDSIPKVNVCVTQFSKIQFNAIKFIKKSITLEAYTNPETGQLEFAGLFPGIPTDITNEGKTCCAAEPVEEPAVVDKGEQDFKLSNILFDFDQTDIKPEYFGLLDKIAGILINTPSMKVTINGHTDIIGADDYNQSLSMNRARTVAQYLINAGIISERITVYGYGFSTPVADNNTDEGKALNRRVEILLVD